MELQKNIIGKWYLVSDDIVDDSKAYCTKNDTTYVEFFKNKLCKGFLVDPFHKYTGTWEIKNGYLDINYNNNKIEYWFQKSNDTLLILTTLRSFGSGNRFLKRNNK